MEDYPFPYMYDLRLSEILRMLSPLPYIYDPRLGEILCMLSLNIENLCIMFQHASSVHLMHVRVHKNSKVTEPDFSGKVSLGPNRAKRAQNVQKIDIFNFLSETAY